MLLDIQKAINVVKRSFPDEGEMDPFYSVDRKTGEFRDFSIITDGDTTELMSLFMAAKDG